METPLQSVSLAEPPCRILSIPSPSLHLTEFSSLHFSPALSEMTRSHLLRGACPMPQSPSGHTADVIHG